MTAEEPGGIDEEKAHPRARQLLPDAFFWDCTDELAPFGSDEGDTALREFRTWRRANPQRPVEECLLWTIESVGEMAVADYDDALLAVALVRSQVQDPAFDDQQYVFTLDTSVIATAFGQLVDEGRIDASAKPYAQRALRRQVIWAGCQPGWKYAPEYIRRLSRMQQVLAAA